jgi:hypothetical protein
MTNGNPLGIDVPERQNPRQTTVEPYQENSNEIELSTCMAVSDLAMSIPGLSHPSILRQLLRKKDF